MRVVLFSPHGGPHRVVGYCHGFPHVRHSGQVVRVTERSALPWSPAAPITLKTAVFTFRVEMVETIDARGRIGSELVIAWDLDGPPPTKLPGWEAAEQDQ
jgi:hypothetical protein